ncbi:MAG: hypothetical protein EU529_10570 [Promethearchaeota archaeon]|nr:MAG: hypothetical protein EU529_10570 [Candidatus Lokiarchaeota archaeon]
MVDINIDEINKKISNPTKEFASLKGFEIISENLVYKIYDLFGRNALLSMLYQIGKGTSEIITKRIKEKYKKDVFELEEAFQILLEELKDFYSVQIKDVEISKDKIRLIIENRCFLREPIKDRERLKYGKAFCRINKGYFETAFTDLTKIKKVDINFLENDEKKDVCIEELVFYLND